MCGIDRLATQELRHNMNIVEGGKQAEPSSVGPASRPNHPTNRTSQGSEQRRGRTSVKSSWLGYDAQPIVLTVTSSKKRLNYTVKWFKYFYRSFFSQ